MIFLVSRNKSLFESTRYATVSFKEAMEILLPLRIVQLDTETTGLDPHTKKLLTVQLGNKQNQVVFDWTTLTPEEKLQLKEYLESDRVFLGWNLMFDLGFFYVEDIWPWNIRDGMIIEKLLWLGYTPEEHPMSLQAAVMFYLHKDMDKSVRGKIIQVGLTEDVVVYAAGDVTELEDIYNLQMEQVEAQELQQAVAIENAFIPSLTYFKHCGVLLDVPRWRKKMEANAKVIEDTKQQLDEWVVNWCKQHPLEGGTDIQYVDVWHKTEDEINELTKPLRKLKYKRYPKEDAKGPGSILLAYKRDTSFVKVDLQGDLFSGFSTEPKCTINWNSADQVIPFFKLLGINTKTFDKKTKKEKDSVEKNVLKPQKDKFPILKIFLAYKEAVKLYSTYGQNWIDAINEKTGRIHVEFHSIGTDTARVSSGGGVHKLNLQNLPHDAETRACFIAGSGNKWISADYQSQESRIIASVAQDEAMIDLFENGCGDVHSLVAKMSYPNIIPADTRVEDIKDLYKPQRQDAKGIE